MRRPGQSLLELLVAFFIIAVGLLSVLTLVFSNRALVERDADEVVAVNLVREGVEFAKNIRDTNWLAGQEFDTGLFNPSGDVTATPIWEGVISPGILSFNFATTDFEDARTKIMQTSNGLLINRLSAGPPPSGITYTDTPYQRLMKLGPICFNSTAPSLTAYTFSPTSCVGRRVGVRVESRVRTARNGAMREVVIYEDLYDWR